MKFFIQRCLLFLIGMLLYATSALPAARFGSALRSFSMVVRPMAGVDVYRQADQEAVLAIARKELPSLVSLDLYGYSVERALQEDILGALDDSLDDRYGVVSKVYRDERGTPLGFATLGILPVERAAVLHHLAVDHRYRGQGIASALVRAVLEECLVHPTIDEIVLITLDDHVPPHVKRLYGDTCGFTASKREHGPGYVWSKPLTSPVKEELQLSKRVICQDDDNPDDHKLDLDTMAGIASAVVVTGLLVGRIISDYRDYQEKRVQDDD
ncbi:GNAT family N-acetyltransferase [Candidatus Babeliales bacterium]|nr:GNAT family N-acetyltransferase [Candidatus Babeliales bacterium]